MTIVASKMLICKRGHVFDAANTYLTPHGWRLCRQCRNIRKKRWKLENKERYREIEKGVRELAKARGKKPAPRKRQHERLWAYGLTVADYESLLNKQLRLCAICLRSVPLQVDHDHTSGKVRGLLCGPCNRGLAMFRENIEALNRAIEYLAVAR